MGLLEERYLRAKRRLFDLAYASLNECQRQAIFRANGPLLILAGAGSGKTTVLVRRIAYLIRYGNAYESNRVPEGLTEEKVQQLEAATRLPADQILPLLDEFADMPCDPYRVLAITFTNKAANEIKARLGSMFPEHPEYAGQIFTGTFHSVCARILRQHGDMAGYRPGFSIYDTDDGKKAYAEALRRCNIDEKILPIKMVANAVSRAKDKLMTPEEMEEEAGVDYRLSKIAKVYAAYQQILRESNAMDFDDLIMQTVLLFRRHPEVAQAYQNRFRYVCVDEYQDTNPAQFELTRFFAEGYQNLMVVGDDDQSIYKFRGADIGIILSFDRAYPRATVIKLEQNYRSTQNILDAANAVIAKNTERKGKNLWTQAGKGSLLHLIRCEDQNEESRKVVDVINRSVARGEAKYRDFAVLYRMNAQSQNLEKAFARSAVPYRLLGGTRFTDRKEIRDVIAYLQMLVNPSDNARLRRIINEPKRKIGDKTLDAIADIAQELGCSQFEVVANAHQYVALKNTASTLLAFAGLIEDLTQKMNTGTPLDALFDMILDQSGYRQMLIAEGEVSADRLENIEEFKSQIMEYMKENETPTLGGFLEETALVAEVDKYDENADAVVLMTIHSAKGLEFPMVILPGMEDGIFPGSQSIEGGQAEMEEERRLAYVAITRAKKELYILHTGSRMLFGRTAFYPLSRFVSEIPGGLIQKEGYPTPLGGTPGYHGVSPSSASKRIYFQEGAEKKTDYFSPSVQKKPTPPPASEQFSPGDKVRHMTFGVGEVFSVKPMGADILYEIVFDSVGTKKLMGTYAKLKKL